MFIRRLIGDWRKRIRATTADSEREKVMKAIPEILACLSVGAAVFGTRLYHFLACPELTEMQAFRTFWPAYAFAGVVMFAYIGLRLKVQP